MTPVLPWVNRPAHPRASVRLRASLLAAALVDVADAVSRFMGIEETDPARVFRAYRERRVAD